MSITGQKTSGNKGTNSGYQVATTEIEKLLLQRITAAGGSELISTGQEATGKHFYGFIVQENTNITKLKGGVPPDKSQDYLTIMGLAGKTLKQGGLYLLPIGEVITDVTVTGSIIGYNQK